MRVPTMHQNSLDFITKLIALIESYDLNQSFDDLYNLIGQLLNEVPVAGIQLGVPYDILDLNIPEHMFGCFRVRKFKSIQDAKAQIKDPRSFWARPKELVYNYGRCHSPKEEILYCSNNMIVALSEIQAEVGDVCAIARLVSKKNAPRLDLISLGDSRHKFTEERYNPYGINIDSQLDEINLKKLELIENFVIKSFRKKISPHEEFKYKLTAAIAKFCFHEPAKMILSHESIIANGILYPSIKAGYSCYNMAFKNSVFQNHLEISNIFCIEITKVEGFQYTFDLIDEVIGLATSWNNQIPSN